MFRLPPPQPTIMISFIPTGNRRFRITASLFLKKYLKASTHKAKSDVVSEVLGIIYESCPVGAFIKYQNGRWYEVDKRTSREKVGAYFRDCCADQYKSSAKNKAARRRQKKEAERRMEADGCSFVSASTTTTTEPTETSSSVPSDFSY